jgi:hypothetical protein
MGQEDGDGLGTLGSAMLAADTREADVMARLAIVQERLLGDGTTNPNLEDTPDKLCRHGCYQYAKAA